MTTTDAPRRRSGHACFPTAPASFDLPCARTKRCVACAAPSAATREGVRVRWYGGRRELLPVVFDGHFTERPEGAVLEGHYRHARRTKLVCNFVLGLCVVILVFGIMGMTLLWMIGSGAAADRWLTSVIVLGLIGVSALALLKGRLPLRPAHCDELSGAIRSALQIAPAR
jgi:uncharacterized membrane protein YqjE